MTTETREPNKSKDSKTTTAPTQNASAQNAPAMRTPKKGKRVESMMAAPWKPEAVGDCLEGIYQGVEIVPGKGSRKPFPSYHILRPDGERVRIASAMLNTKLNQIKKGTYVWLTYKGMYECKNGKSPDYEVVPEEGAELIDPLQGDGDVHEERAD